MPLRKISPKRSYVVIAATLMSSLILLVFVLLRKAIQSALSDKDSALKVKKIKRHLGVEIE